MPYHMPMVCLSYALSYTDNMSFNMPILCPMVCLVYVQLNAFQMSSKTLNNELMT